MLRNKTQKTLPSDVSNSDDISLIEQFYKTKEVKFKIDFDFLGVKLHGKNKPHTITDFVKLITAAYLDPRHLHSDLGNKIRQSLTTDAKFKILLSIWSLRNLMDLNYLSLRSDHQQPELTKTEFEQQISKLEKIAGRPGVAGNGIFIGKAHFQQTL